ncbi:hypothetical protein Trydic_g23810 [Trypoxylus dichotomus]
MTSNFLSESNKLRNIQLNLEKNEQILLENLTKHGATKIVELHEKLEMDRKKELNIIQTELRNMLTSLNKFKSLPVATDREKENLDYKQTKREMILLGENIKYVNYKTKEYICKLKEDEKYFCDDVRRYECKVSEWEKHANLTQSSLKSTETIDQNITDFLTFLTKYGGHTNGWSPEDHNLFLKAQSKCSNTDELCSYLHTILPDISEDEIRAHEKWYLKYLELREKQKQALKIWRSTKSATVPQNKSKESTVKRVTSAYSQIKTLNKQEVKERLDKWRQEKFERNQQKQIVIGEMERRRKETELKNKEKHREVKKIIENWKLAKLEKEEGQLYEKHSLEKKQRLFKSAMANRLIKEFQSNDTVFMKRRIESCKPRIKNIERSSNTIYATRDPSRLLKPTKQWISRIKSREGSYNSKSTTIKTIQKLGIPEWRKNGAISR